MECAGNGRAKLEPRPISQPWLLEAVGTGRWRGTSLGRRCSPRPASASDAVEVLFTGARPRDRERRGAVVPAQPAARRGAAARGAARLRPERRRRCRRSTAFRCACSFPGWYGMTNVKWLSRITRARRAVHRLSAGARLPPAPGSRRARRSRCSGSSRGRSWCRPGIPDFMSRERTVERGSAPAHGPRLVGPRPDRGVEVSVDGGATWQRRDARARRARRVGVARLLLRLAGDRARPRSSSAAAPATRPATSSRSRVPWNVGGYANNAVQRVAVTVR